MDAVLVMSKEVANVSFIYLAKFNGNHSHGLTLDECKSIIKSFPHFTSLLFFPKLDGHTILNTYLIGVKNHREMDLNFRFALNIMGFSIRRLRRQKLSKNKILTIEQILKRDYSK